jgi:hypothetical protein
MEISRPIFHTDFETRIRNNMGEVVWGMQGRKIYLYPQKSARGLPLKETMD